MSPQRQHTPGEAVSLHAHRVRRQALVRFGVFVGVLVAIGIAVSVGGALGIDAQELQRRVRDAGPLAPVVFVLSAAVLAALFVPGPVLGFAGGVLFGALGGSLLGVMAGSLTALIAREITARFGRSAAEDLAGGRLTAVSTWLEQYGLLAVIALRLFPGVPDAPVSYATGLPRMARWKVALGTAIGIAPRTVGWGLIGAAAGDRSTTLGAIGFALVIGADVGGGLLGLLVARRAGIAPRVAIQWLRSLIPSGGSPTMRPMRIAIDGPAGAGKSTVARLVAERLGFTYLDSGAMYRCAALVSLRGGTPTQVEVSFDPDGRVLLGGEDVSAEIRSPEVSAQASVVATDPAVRAGLVTRQQALMATGDWVAEGRDIGTVVVPDAELKIYLDADPLERAQRRAEQLGADVQEILAQQNERDERDRTRQTAPLVAADDAVVVDTTGLSIDQVVDRIAELARERRS